MREQSAAELRVLSHFWPGAEAPRRAMPKGGRKKIVIPQFKAAAADTDGMWRVLEAAIRQIFAKEQSKLSYEVLYRNAYNMVLHKQGELLYTNVRKEVAAFLSRRAAAIGQCNAGEFMGALEQQWKDFRLAITLVRDVCMYLDRTWVDQQPETVPPVFEMGLSLFQRIVARDGSIKKRLLDTMLDYVEREREGEPIPRQEAKTISGMWYEISARLYEEDFETPLLETSRLYYTRLAQSLVGVEGHSCAGFFAEVERRLEDEAARTVHYLHESTGPKLRAVVEETMLAPHSAAELADPATGLRQQLLRDELEDLQRQYTLLRPDRVRVATGEEGGGGSKPLGLEFLSEKVAECLGVYSTETVTDSATADDPVAFVSSLLAMQAKFNALLSGAFRSDSALEVVMRRCLADGLNLRDSVAKQLVDYVDALLRKGGLPQPPEESAVEGCLEQVLTLYVHLKDKDVFNQYYKRAVSSRMLGDKSISEYLEQAFVSKVKLRCGASHMHDVETMLQDIKQSEDMVAKFEGSEGRREAAGPQLSFRILNERVWPSYRLGEPLLLP